MSCKDFESNIYLYTELSVREKDQLDLHLQTCPACTALFEEVNQMQNILHRVAEEHAMPANAAKLASSIMTKITSGKKIRTVSLIDLFFIRARFTMTVLSIGLLISFAVEFLNGTPSPSEPKVMAETPILLIGKAFRKNLANTHTESGLFAGCRSPFQSGKEYLNCVKSKLK